jgi:Fe-S-cluster containining protein
MSGDEVLIRIVDAAMAEAARKSGPWLVCRSGCTECCMGPFPITQLDARRLREGLAKLDSCDRQRAARVRERARQAVARISPDFPGEPATGVLGEDEEAEEQFAALADDQPCPALDPATGTCDLYAARPITCRMFGPPVRCGSEAVGVCELCFQGASDQEIAAGGVEIDPQGLESRLSDELERTTGARGQTIVAFALVAAGASYDSTSRTLAASCAGENGLGR